MDCCNKRIKITIKGVICIETKIFLEKFKFCVDN